MADTAISRGGDRLGAYALFAAVLSGAGLPIYIYAPKFFADNYGVSLATLGAVLFGLRLFDFVQDPVLGWISERLKEGRGIAIAFFAALLGASMLGLFAVAPPISPVWWFGLTITGLFTAFSFLTINFYARGVAKAGEISGGHTRLAAWRETGALLGVCLAAMAPTLLTAASDAPFAAFAVGFAGVTLVAAAIMAPEWSVVGQDEPTSIRAILSDPVARRLLLLALVNATPVAVSSTLFLFFVESRLAAPGWEGPLLVVYFLSAAISAPVWARVAKEFGSRNTLLGAMSAAVIIFGFVMTLGAGDVMIFAVICVLSGFVIGADFTLLPALFARRMADIAPNGGQGFGLWATVSKFTLAFAAVVLFPVLEGTGFTSGSLDNPERALITLSILYAAVPCALKLVAIGLLVTTKLEE